MEDLGFRPLSRDLCVELLATARVGRVGLSLGALPTILPVNFMLTTDGVVFRTAAGSKLDAALARAVVAFEVDGHHPEGHWGWSVLVQGMATEIASAAELAEVRTLPLPAWALGDLATRYVGVPLTFVSGRAFGRLPQPWAGGAAAVVTDGATSC